MLENIGKKIRIAREDASVSQKDLGMTLGLSDKAISAYESSRTVPPLETLIRIADELSKPLDFFIKDDASDFAVETQLANMEKNVTKLLSEIQEIKELLSSPSSQNNSTNSNGSETKTPQCVDSIETI